MTRQVTPLCLLSAALQLSAASWPSSLLPCLPAHTWPVQGDPTITPDKNAEKVVVLRRAYVCKQKNDQGVMAKQIEGFKHVIL